jgi:hypothetical protein
MKKNKVGLEEGGGGGDPKEPSKIRDTVSFKLNNQHDQWTAGQTIHTSLSQ